MIKKVSGIATHFLFACQRGKGQAALISSRSSAMASDT